MRFHHPSAPLRRRPGSPTRVLRLAAVSLLALAACSNTVASSRSEQSTSTRFPDDVRANFIDSCTASGGSATRCGCMLDQFEQHYSISEFTLFEISLNSGGELPPEVLELLANC